MGKNILVVLGHSGKNSFCGSLAQSYTEAAVMAGNRVVLLDVGELAFDPVLWEGYNEKQTLEPGLLEAQRNIKWAQHLVFIYPIWWGALPALLKGFIDRVFLPGFAFRYKDDSPLYEKLLSGRTGHLIATMDTPPWYYRWVYRMPGHNEMKKTILEFCGVRPVKVTSFGPIKNSTDVQRSNWLKIAGEYGRTA